MTPREPGPPPDAPHAVAATLDNRGLEPPMPMVLTLEAYGDLAAGAVLRIHNDRVPVYLLPQLEDRGARYEIHEQPDGSAIVDIRKPAPGGDADPA